MTTLDKPALPPELVADMHYADHHSHLCVWHQDYMALRTAAEQRIAELQDLVTSVPQLVRRAEAAERELTLRLNDYHCAKIDQESAERRVEELQKQLTLVEGDFRDAKAMWNAACHDIAKLQARIAAALAVPVPTKWEPNELNIYAATIRAKLGE
jgi:chromosome segregation ATPase